MKQLTLFLTFIGILYPAITFSMADEMAEIATIDHQRFPYDIGFLRDSSDGHETNLETELYLAVATNDALEVEYLLDRGVDPNQQSANGSYLLDIAFYKGNKRIIAALQKHNAKSTTAATLMHYAAWFDDCMLAKKLLQKKVDVNVCRECSITPLHEASFRGNFSIARVLLQNGADPNATNLWGRTPLHDALEQHHWQLAALLVNCTDLNATDSMGHAPWQMIIKNSATIPADTSNADRAAITFLLNAVSLKTAPESKISALHLAAHYLNEQAVNIFLNAGACPNMQNFLGKTPLHDAIEHADAISFGQPPEEILRRQASIVSKLLNAGADANRAHHKGETPFTMAIRHNTTTLFQLFLDGKADPNQRVEGFASLLHYCAAKNRPGLAKLALMYGANKDSTDADGNTPLHIACHYGFTDVISTLLNYKAQIAIRNKRKETAFDIDDQVKKVIRKCPEIPMFAFAQGNHPRLGANSPIQTAAHNIFTNEILAHIYSLLKQ